jgi:hypothetical protein
MKVKISDELHKFGIPNSKIQISSEAPRPQDGALNPKFLKPRTEIPKQVRDDKKRRP